MSSMTVLDATILAKLPPFDLFGPLGEALEAHNPCQGSRRGTICMWHLRGRCGNPSCTFTESQQGTMSLATPCERRWVLTRCAERPSGLFVAMRNEELASFLDDARLEYETVIDETFVREATTVTLNDAQLESMGCDLSKIWFNTILVGDDACWTVRTEHYKHEQIAPVVFAAPNAAPYVPAAGETHLVVQGDGFVGRMPLWQGEHLLRNAERRKREKQIDALLAPGTVPVIEFPHDNVRAWVDGENSTFEVRPCRANKTTLSICFGSFDAVEIEIAPDGEAEDAEDEAEDEDEDEDAPARTINWSVKPDRLVSSDYDEREVVFDVGGCAAFVSSETGRLVFCDVVVESDDDYDESDDDDESDDALARGSYGPDLAADCTSCADRPGTEARCVCASA